MAPNTSKFQGIVGNWVIYGEHDAIKQGISAAGYLLPSH